MTIEDPNLTPAVTTRSDELSPRAIALLNLLLFGVGYALIGQWKKALVAWGAALAIGPITVGFGLFALGIITAIDVHKQVLLQRSGAPIDHWTFFGKAEERGEDL